MGYEVMDQVAEPEESQPQNYIECDVCGGPIYRGDDRHYGDDVYWIDGLNICAACIQDYIKDHKKELM